MPFAKLANVQIYYEWSGTEGAPVLVFSNSLGTTLRMWDTQIEELSKCFRILRYDTRGHGQSTVPPGPYSIGQLGTDVLNLMDTLGLTQVCFCGLSMGGMIGMYLGVHSPSRFHKIILCNTAATIGTPDVWNARIAAVQQGGMKAVAAAVIERWLSKSFRDTHEAQTAAMLAMLENANPNGYVANCAAVRDFDFRHLLSTVNVQTLILSGTYDPVTTPTDSRFLAEHIPNARFVQVPAAHISNIEAQSDFNRETSTFLRA